MEKIIHSENEYAKFKIEEGILIGAFKTEFVDIDIAKKITKSRLEIQKGNNYPILSDIKSIKNTTKPARDYMASEEGCKGVVAAAILIESPVSSMIGNFFLWVSKPLRPTQIFTDEAEAKRWLSQYVTRAKN